MVKTNKTFVQRFLEIIALPDEQIPGQPIVEICGENRVLIENHRGVIEYGTQRIEIRVCFGRVQIFGSGLHLCRMIGRQLIITGKVERIHLQKECI